MLYFRSRISWVGSLAKHSIINVVFQLEPETRLCNSRHIKWEWYWKNHKTSKTMSRQPVSISTAKNVLVQRFQASRFRQNYCDFWPDITQIIPKSRFFTIFRTEVVRFIFCQVKTDVCVPDATYQTCIIHGHVHRHRSSEDTRSCHATYVIQYAYCSMHATIQKTSGLDRRPLASRTHTCVCTVSLQVQCWLSDTPHAVILQHSYDHV